MENTLYYGDNLDILKRYIKDETIDLVYLDPPFNSKSDYNILYKESTGKPSEAQITAFEDTWHWGEDAERTFQEIVDTAPAHVIEMMRAFRQFTGNNDMMAYLTMMCIRLIELRRVLKSTGSIYLHCDPTASHYLKILMDTIFGKNNFRNEIIWQRTSSHNDSRKWGQVHDTILFYTKGNQGVWNPVFTEHDPQYIQNFYRHSDERGVYRLDHIIRSASMGPRPNLSYEYKGYKPEWGWRVIREKLEALDKDERLEWSKTGRPYLKRYLHEQKGTPIKSVITDIPPIGAQAAERLGYPTQKPELLLERIILSSSNEGDIILDPFCGCGTTITSAQKTKRRWIGIDVTHLAVNLIKWRMKHMFSLEPRKDYIVIGEPEDLTGAQELAGQNRYQFQWWSLSLIDARPYGDKKKGKDTGIDGYIYFSEEKDKTGKGIVSVKSGKTSSRDIRDLGHVMDREGAELGIFITLHNPSKDMTTEAVSKGFYKSKILGSDFPRIQILTIEDLLNGKKPEIPWQVSSVKKASKADTDENMGLF